MAVGRGARPLACRVEEGSSSLSSSSQAGKNRMPCEHLLAPPRALGNLKCQETPQPLYFKEKST